MNFLKKLFNIGNEDSDQKRGLSPEMYDLLLDWFNESGTNITSFENDFFEPIIKIYRTNDNKNQYFGSNPEEARREYFPRLAFRYLIYKLPDNSLLKRFFELEKVPYDFHRDICHYYNVSWSGNKNLDLSRPLEIGSMIAGLYHAIYLKKDFNISYLPADFDKLKFNEDKEVFTRVFDYVRKQSFEEKLHLFQSLKTSTNTKYVQKSSEDGIKSDFEKITISTSSYDRLIDTALQEVVREHEQMYHVSLNNEIIELFKDLVFKAYESDKVRTKAENIKVADIFIERVKGNELSVLEHIIYYLRNEYIYEKDNKHWLTKIEVLLKSPNITSEWLEKLIDLMLADRNLSASKRYYEIKNADIIFLYIITPAFKYKSSLFSYSDPVVQKYEELLFKRTTHVPEKEGLDILHTIAERIGNIDIRNFILSKLSAYCFDSTIDHYSFLSFDESDKKYTTIKQFINDLNILVPVALKKIVMPFYSFYDEDNSLLILNYNNQDVEISYSFFAKSVNELLEKAESPYRLIPIPMYVRQNGGYNEYSLLVTMAFMNSKEFDFFLNYYMTPENVEKWQFKGNKFTDNKLFTGYIVKLAGLTTSFTDATDIPFLELKRSKLNTQTSSSDDNAFLSDVNWDWFRVKYIDNLGSKEQWYEIMDLMCQCSKGKKPAKAWLADLKNAMENFGIEKYFKELQVLISSSIKEESWFFDQYAVALKGLIWSCAYIKPNDTSLGILKMITERCYTKIPGIGAISTVTGNLALDALVASQKEEAYGMMSLMRNKTKYNKFAVALEKFMDKFKETSPFPEQLLADKTIPNFGFRNGKKTFDVEGYSIVIGFNKRKLTKEHFDKQGGILKKLPVDFEARHAIALKEINAEIKQINTVFNDLGKRVKTYWLFDRTWAYSDWKKYILDHALLYPHIESLIWTNETQQVDFIVLDGQMRDMEDNPVASNPDDIIRLWHPVINTEENILRWQNYLWENKIVQHQRQAFRENYPFSETELAMSESPRFAHHFLEVNKLMAIANNTGWIFTYSHEGQSWPRIYLRPLNITAHMRCDYDRFSYAIPTKVLYFTDNNTTKMDGYFIDDKTEGIKLSEVPIVMLSEICRDIDLFIATSSIANDVELSENRQEYESYRVDYQKGLFSDNANAKVRGQILEKLAPILKLNIERIEGNFVIIKGKSDTYRINLNSGFAQSRDTQKHINLIPNIKKIKADKKIRLPIEDDETLYIILAKILHLQEV